MTEAAYFLSKDAEEALSPFVQKLILTKKLEPIPCLIETKISSPLVACPWDIAVNITLLVDIKIAFRAREYGKIAPKTLEDIKKALKDSLLVALYVPPKLYLLTPSDLPTIDQGQGLPIDVLERFPSVWVDQQTEEEVWAAYRGMLTS